MKNFFTKKNLMFYALVTISTLSNSMKEDKTSEDKADGAIKAPYTLIATFENKKLDPRIAKKKWCNENILLSFLPYGDTKVDPTTTVQTYNPYTNEVDTVVFDSKKQIWDACVSPNNKLIHATHFTDTILGYNLETKERYVMQDPEKRGAGVVASTDTELVTDTNDFSLNVWDIERKALKKTCPLPTPDDTEGFFVGLKYKQSTACALYISSLDKKNVYIWDTRIKECALKILDAPSLAILLDVSDDLMRLAASGSSKTTPTTEIYIYDLRKTADHRTINVGDTGLYSLQISPDKSKIFYSGLTDDGTKDPIPYITTIDMLNPDKNSKFYIPNLTTAFMQKDETKILTCKTIQDTSATDSSTTKEKVVVELWKAVTE